MSEYRKKGLGKLAARGALVTISGQFCKISIQLGGLVILARLLKPTDYGLMAMILVIAGIGEVLRDFGLSTAAIQSKTLSVDQRNNLFWINTLIGGFLAACLFVCSTSIATFYGEPQLVEICKLISLTFLINGLATQYRAQLNRELKFSRLSIIDVLSPGIAVVTAIILAARGYGVWALVAQQLAQVMSTFILLVAASKWLPGPPKRHASMGQLVRNGWNLMNTQIMVYASRNLDSLIIGQKYGAEVLGIYNRAFQLLMLPINQINSPATTLALPILSRLQSDQTKYDAFLLRGQTILLYVTAAIFAFSCANAHALIGFVLGSQWAAAAPLFQILSIGGLFQAAAYTNYWVFLSKGLTGSNFRFSLLTRSVVILLVSIGAQWSVEGAAIAVTIGSIFTWMAGLFWLRRSNAPVMQLFQNGCVAIIGFSLCGLASWISALRIEGSNGLQLLVGIGGMISGFIVLLLVWPSFRRRAVSIADTRRFLKSS